MRRTAIVAGTIALLWAVAPRAGAATLVVESEPYPGVIYQYFDEPEADSRVHVVIVDLTSSELTVVATDESQRGTTPSQFADASGAQIVINGDAFALPGFMPAGLAMGESGVWSQSRDTDAVGFVAFGRAAARTEVTVSPPSSVVEVDNLPAGTQGVVGGRPLVVRSGVAESAFDCADAVAMPCTRAPRAAVARSADGERLYLIVVDGWQAGSAGMTAAELGAFIAELGAISDALMLDGGGAAAMYIAAAGGVVSSPSDGVERKVANHLAVRYGSLPTGQLAGFIRERDIFDESANIEGATVALDTGAQVTTGADGNYNFPEVTARLACVTASAPGYRTENRCAQVESGELTYNSIALFPSTDFVDAGPGAPDAGTPDAGPDSPDTGTGPGTDAGDAPADAGEPGVEGGCQAGTGGSPRPPAWLFLVATLAVATLARRHRRRNDLARTAHS